MMEQLALYREWRPQSFEDLVGQEHVSRTLRNAVSAERVAHAYIFCGPRGTGKTSTARIFAKALNCPQAAEGEPCNKCDSCRSITIGNALDVIEMDAASHRGIEEIRDLKQKVGLAPPGGRYKVYIIDEVHMLTGEAFNALLKTLEEPPRHIVFVLATTEANKVPPTILSRCQRFDFRRLGREVIAEHLARIASSKGWDVDQDALALLARQASGAMRDALGLLDQAASFGGGRVTRSDVEALTGAFNEETLRPLLDAIWSGDLPAMLTALDALYAQGAETRQILYQLLDFLREHLFTTDQLQGRYAALLRDLAAAEGEMRVSSRPDLILELALLRQAGVVPTTGSGVVQGAAELQTGLPSQASINARRGVAQGRSGERMAAPDQVGASAATGVKSARGVATPEAAVTMMGSVDGESEADTLARLRSFLQQHCQQQPVLFQVVASCQLAQVGNRVKISAPSTYGAILQKEEKIHLLQQCTREFSGGALELELTAWDEAGRGAGGQRANSAGNERRQAQPQQVSAEVGDLVAGHDGEQSVDSLVAVALSLFKGKIINIREEGD